MKKDELIEIAEFFASSQLNRLAWKEGDFSLELEKQVEQTVVLAESDASLKHFKRSPSSVKDDNIAENDGEPIPDENTENNYFLRSPVVGTFYSAPSPEAEPFVRVGQEIAEGDVVCIIEAMKVFSEIKSPVAGVVKNIFPKDQELIEFDQKIIEIEEH